MDRGRAHPLAWVFTLPVCGLIGYFTERLCVTLGYK
jgi:hypothetical protein